MIVYSHRRNSGRGWEIRGDSRRGRGEAEGEIEIGMITNRTLFLITAR